MRAASRQPVWSFHSQHCAARLSLHFPSSASGRFARSTGIGLDPVVSTPMPTTFAASKPGLPLRGRERAVHALLEAEEVVARVLPRQMVVLGIEQDALPAAGIVDDATAEFRAVRATHDQRAHRVGAEVDAEREHSRSQKKVCWPNIQAAPGQPLAR